MLKKKIGLYVSIFSSLVDNLHLLMRDSILCFVLLNHLVDHLLDIGPAVAEHVQDVHQAQAHRGVLKLLLEQEEILFFLLTSLLHECSE